MYYKTLNSNLSPCHGGKGDYTLGIWTPSIQPIPCTKGYHICTEDYLLEWLATRIFEVEVRGKIVSSEMKLTAESIKLTKELVFNPYQFLSQVISRIQRPESPFDKAIKTANFENNQIALFEALAYQAYNADDTDCALQVVPKRVAQAKAFLSYKQVVDKAWEETKGDAPEYFWRRVYQDAEDAKRSAHDKEREFQRELLFSMMR